MLKGWRVVGEPCGRLEGRGPRGECWKGDLGLARLQSRVGAQAREAGGDPQTGTGTSCSSPFPHPELVSRRIAAGFQSSNFSNMLQH